MLFLHNTVKNKVNKYKSNDEMGVEKQNQPSTLFNFNQSINNNKKKALYVGL